MSVSFSVFFFFFFWGESSGEHQKLSFKLEPTHFPLNNSGEQRAGRVDTQLLENTVCHLDTTFWVPSTMH